MKHFFPVVIAFLTSLSLFSQQEELKPFSLELDYFYGSILEHNPDIEHLITNHPVGLVMTYNRKTYGFNEWERRYRYPDWGVTFAYHNSMNDILGDQYALYGHFNWYFYNRNLVIRMGQGVSYATNPYDLETNVYNNAYGTRLVSTTFLKANYIRENVYKGFGFHLGFNILHFSNANFRAPNNSTNTFGFNAGVSYLFDHENFPELISAENDPPSSSHAEPIAYNFVFRFGLNESDVVRQGQFPFYVVSAFADKRINYKSTLQAGVDVFFSKFLEELIYFRSVAYPEDGVSGDEDYKRVGLFIGHELRFNKVAFVSQLGYYVYWPYAFENRIYNRLGLKRYFLDNKLFASITVKAHWAKAEGVEFGLGIRL
ncbi:acyloxyacyl hydrolase [Ulvibacter antarcticus]|uniref:Lipid A 3-O-deacylase PagL n=1 Tax=Ulvibacter antarcticus TaxID=442714 RepID=A0A3L9YH44_9FLAO|nr:acyloxyacyl hydrolase [Ulvibacter antarcticus]RMA57208.1 lipid A 3-O-deacylase PagL [Ulvibacter antarcticus]